MVNSEAQEAAIHRRLRSDTQRMLDLRAVFSLPIWNFRCCELVILNEFSDRLRGV